MGFTFPLRFLNDDTLVLSAQVCDKLVMIAESVEAVRMYYMFPNSTLKNIYVSSSVRISQFDLAYCLFEDEQIKYKRSLSFSYNFHFLLFFHFLVRLGIFMYFDCSRFDM